MQVRKCVYTLSDFKELLARRIAKERLGETNMQSDEALELLNEILPRNMMVRKLFREDDEALSIMDAN